MLCRLNHELLPDPGNPIASTTVPLLARTGDGATPACTAGAGATTAGNFPATTGSGTGGSAANGSPADGSATTAPGAVAARERDPPRPPRPRRRRDVRAFGSTAADAAEADSGAASGSGLDGRCTSATGAWAETSPGTSTGVTGSSS